VTAAPPLAQLLLQGAHASGIQPATAAGPTGATLIALLSSSSLGLQRRRRCSSSFLHLLRGDRSDDCVTQHDGVSQRLCHRGQRGLHHVRHHAALHAPCELAHGLAVLLLLDSPCSCAPSSRRRVGAVLRILRCCGTRGPCGSFRLHKRGLWVA